MAEVPEAQAVRLTRGQKVTAALQADPSQTFTGTMTEILPQVKNICQQELNWNQDRWHSEEQRYLSLWRQHYFLPGAPA